jgi:Zn-dependent protease
MNWQNIINSLPGIILGLTLHEFCHAWASYKLGDTTARDMGRLTFNPLKHIDPLGFLFIIFAGFGWARPVQFSPANLKKPRRDKALIAAAGPLSNFLLALVFILLVKAYLALGEHFYISENWELFSLINSSFFVILMRIILQAVVINLGLFVFNLIPIPPLDGSHILFSGLNLKNETESQIMKIGAPLLFIIIIIQNRTSLTILPIGNLVRVMLNFFIPELRAS